MTDRFYPTAILVLVLLFIGSGLATAQVCSHRNPPPLPSESLREKLLAGEYDLEAIAAMDGKQRAVHDEYDVIHYDVDLEIDILHYMVNGTVTIDATAEASNLSEIEVDLFTCMIVSSVLVNGSPVLHEHNGDILQVPLDATYQIDDPFSVQISYSGRPAAPGMSLPFRWSFHDGTPIVYSYSEPYGAPSWWACKDDPKDKATYAIHLTVRDDLIAVSCGLLDSEVDNGDGTKTFNWITNYPMSTYLFSIAVTNFESWTDVYTALDGETTMNVDYYAYPEDFADAQVSWSYNIEMMEYFAGLFGEYPFLDEKYGIAEFHHGGAMEHQTCTSMGHNWITGTHSNDFVVAHELAHSWVGDMITMNEWSHAWTKEGFATYCEALYFEDKYGVSYYHSYMAGIPVMSYAHKQLYDIDPPLDGAIYYKGAWVLHMLRHLIGDAAFFDGVYDYTNTPELRYGSGNTEDLRYAFEGSSGIDLEWFFDQWIYHPGYPIYQIYWWPEEVRDGYDVHLWVDQIQTTGPLFKMPIDVQITTTGSQENFVVWDSLATQTFTFHVADEPTTLEFDPDDWIIKRIEQMSDVGDNSPTGDYAIGGVYPNPCTTGALINYSLATATEVSVSIFDVSGRQVKSLLNRVQPAGRNHILWDGTDNQKQSVPPGIYYCYLKAGDVTSTKRIVRIR